MPISTDSQLLTLLQLASPALPIGAYSYSEGIEALVTQGVITNSIDLLHWLTQELTWGAIRVETALMRWVYEAAVRQDFATIADWNQWLSAFRETEEMRLQSWQMGRSLLRLFLDLEPELATRFPENFQQNNCNYAIAYGLVTQAWEIPLNAATLAYLQSWAANLVSAGVRVVPLGQTEGQRLLRQLADPLQQAHAALQAWKEDDLTACSWGVSLASMQHEIQYSRLFRS
ncbi:MAG: urease accessory protein UreF [Leptolyngbya sp. SIO1D8]|nr:urease accessory protein UreF [Leptolyngbya sp. SIO1D8]